MNDFILTWSPFLLGLFCVIFTYGRLTQKVNDLCRRVSRLEDLLSGGCEYAKEKNGKEKVGPDRCAQEC